MDAATPTIRESLDDLTEDAPLMEDFHLEVPPLPDGRARHMRHGDIHPVAMTAWYCAQCMAFHELDVLHPAFSDCAGSRAYLDLCRDKTQRLLSTFGKHYGRPDDAASIFGSSAR